MARGGAPNGCGRLFRPRSFGTPLRASMFRGFASIGAPAYVAGVPPAASAVVGRYRVKTVPRPGSLSTQM